MTTISEPTIHHFYSTGEAYDASQCREEIKDGDVLTVELEGVVGFLYKAWPIAVTTKYGDFHGPATDSTESDICAEDDLYKESYAVARQEIERLDLS